jgi:hypothetical protein
MPNRLGLFPGLPAVEIQIGLLSPIGNGKHETVSEYEKHAN